MAKAFGARKHSSPAIPDLLILADDSACCSLYPVRRVMSLLLAGLIVALLFVHYVQYVRGRQGNARTENQKRVRVAGRHFMLENTLFVLTIGLLALFMSEVVRSLAFSLSPHSSL